MILKKFWYVVVSAFILLIGFVSPKPLSAQFGGDLGSISGTVKWGSVNYPGPVGVSITNSSGAVVAGGSNPNFSTGNTLLPDTYTVTAKATQHGGDNYSTLIGTQTITLAQGQAVTGVDFDAFNLIGIVKGSLTINGASGAGYVKFCGPQATDPCSDTIKNDDPDGPWFNIDNGSFTAYMPAGNYRAHAVTLQSIAVGTVPVTVTAGQTLEDPSLQFSLNFGSISGTVKLGTDTYPGPVGVSIISNTTGAVVAGFSSSVFNTGAILTPDTYTVTAKTVQHGGDIYNTLIGTETITVASGQSVTGVNFNAFNLIGIVKGTLKINGSPASGYVKFCGPQATDPCTDTIKNDSPDGPWFNIDNGSFTAYMPAGNYRAHAVTLQPISVGTVPVTVIAGQTIEDSSLQFSLNLGSISGTVKWGTDNYPGSLGVSIVSNTSGAIVANFSNAVFNTGATLTPDTYTVTAKTTQHGGDTYSTLIGTQTVTVVSGQSVVGVNFDAFNLIGIVKGTLKINGASASGYVKFCGPQETDPCSDSILNDSPDGPWFNIDNGSFTAYLPPGNYRAHAVTLQSISVGTIPVTVTAGQTLDLASSIVNVPTGQNVTVNVGGITVTFADVTTSGFLNLTTTSHPQGGPPPSQYRFLGTYYELTTTASYSGPITVQFTYNDNDVLGPETNLKLFHWDGSGWQNITVSVDTVNNIITGTTQTLSPFAIGEPPFVNSSPIVGEITAPTDPQLINTSINTSVSFTDAESGDTHTAIWNWGDTTTSAGTVDQQNNTITGSHTYITPGVYEINMTVTDNHGASDQPEHPFQYLVIYDSSASGGFVTGAGSIDSPEGAYISHPTLTGIARFGFVSKYQPGANIPIGNTQFKFQAADFTFSSTDYQWLVVAGPQAKFKGTGTLNGTGNYGFQLSATDGAINGGGGVDKFRIKIWDKNNNNDTVIYDNQMGTGDNANPTTSITGGNIVIH